MDRYNGEPIRDRSRGSRERDTGDAAAYGRLNTEREGNYGRGRGRSPGMLIVLSIVPFLFFSF
jgi:hypothetical protein